MSLPTDLVDTETLIRWRNSLTKTLDDVDDVHSELCKIIRDRQKTKFLTREFPKKREEILSRLLYIECAKEYRV